MNRRRGSERVSNAERPGRAGWPAAISLTAGICLLYLFAAASTTLWDRDEPRFARATVEMIDSGDWLVPTFNGRLRADKPPLTYWLMSIPVSLLGPGAFACRLMSVAGAAATCLLTYYSGRRLFGARAGLWAVAVLATTPMMIVTSTLCTADAIMLPLVWAPLACFAASVTGGPRTHHLLLLGLTAGLAMLAKGPMGLTPLVVIAAAVLFGRHVLPLGWRYAGLAALALVAGAGLFWAWAIPASAATDGAILQQHFGRHVLQRATEPLEGHGGSSPLWLGFYVPVVILAAFPWVGHLLPAAAAAWGGRLGGLRGKVLLLAATVPMFVVMSLAGTKLPHYILVIWPGLALAVGAVIDAHAEKLLTDGCLRWVARGAVLQAVMGAMAVAGGVVVAMLWPGAATAAIAVGVLAGGSAIVGGWLLRQRKLGAAATVQSLGMCLALLTLYGGLTPAAEQAKAVPELGRWIDRHLPADAPLATFGFDEPSVVFYSRRPVHSFDDQSASAVEVRRWLSRPGEGMLLTTARHLRRMEGTGVVAATPVCNARHYNVARGRWVHLVVLARESGRRYRSGGVGDAEPHEEAEPQRSRQ